MLREVIRGAFAPAWVAQLATLPPSTTNEIAGPLAEPALLANPRLAPRLTELLGAHFVMGRLALGLHARTHLSQLPVAAALFGNADIDARLPLFGVTMWVPMRATTVDVGETTVTLAVGDALLVDSRIALVPDDAPALLVVYYRHWFREPRASPTAPPVSISLLRYRRLPAAQRTQFAWRVDRYLHLRPRLLVDAVRRRLQERR